MFMPSIVPFLSRHNQCQSGAYSVLALLKRNMLRFGSENFKIVALWHLAGFRCGTWQAMVDTDIGISRPFYTLFRSSLDLFLCLGFMRKIRRRAYELYMSGALDGSPGASWKEARGDCPAARCRIFRTDRGILLYYCLDNSTALRSSHCWLE